MRCRFCPNSSSSVRARNGNFAAAGGVGGADAAAPHDDAARREIRTLDVVHEVEQICLGVIQHADTGVDDLAQIVGRNIRRHADSNSRRAVDQQVRETGRQHARLFSRLVEVRVPVDGVLIDVAQHLVAELRHARLGVSIRRGEGRRRRSRSCRGRQRACSAWKNPAPDGPSRRRPTHRRADDTGPARRRRTLRTFFERFVRRQPVFIHGVQNAPVDGL